MTVYLVGVEYDDFSEGGFSIVSVCDNIETANRMVAKVYHDFPGVKKEAVCIRTLESNKFYSDWM